MDVRSARIEKLERILEELLQINALAPAMRECQFQIWLNLAISETRSQIDRVRLRTIH